MPPELNVARIGGIVAAEETGFQEIGRELKMSIANRAARQAKVKTRTLKIAGCGTQPPDEKPKDTIANQEKRYVLFGIRQGVSEIVGMLAVGDDDVHCASEPGELTCARVWNDDNVELWRTAIHGGVVLQNKCSRAAVKRTRDAFDGNVTGGTLHRGTGGQHFAFAGSLQIAVKLFVAGHAAERVVVRLVGRI